MLIDEAYITAQAGKGGDGRSSFFPGKGKTSPDGGDGGKGGDVYAKVNPQMQSLNRYSEKKLFKAGNGKHGQGFRREGKAGEDLVLLMPPGTTLIDTDTKQEIELKDPEKPVLLCRGGKGGRGNDRFKSSTNVAPRFSEPGMPGKERHFKVIMKLIADYGLIGLPNAGKSSLLNELTRAQARVANYAFTTLEPNLGALNGKILADIPGLIEGASQGKGLGVKFLKHIEKVSLLIHCIAADSTDPVHDYETVEKELAAFKPGLTSKSELILITKSDLVSSQELKDRITLMELYGKKVMTVSIYDWDKLMELKDVLQ